MDQQKCRTCGPGRIRAWIFSKTPAWSYSHLHLEVHCATRHFIHYGWHRITQRYLGEGRRNRGWRSIGLIHMICESVHIILFEVEMIQVWINLVPKKNNFNLCTLRTRSAIIRNQGPTPNKSHLWNVRNLGKETEVGVWVHFYFNFANRVTQYLLRIEDIRELMVRLLGIGCGSTLWSSSVGKLVPSAVMLAGKAFIR